MAQHPIPPEPPVIVPPNRDVPDPMDPMRRGPDRQLPPDSTPGLERLELFGEAAIADDGGVFAGEKEEGVAAEETGEPRCFRARLRPERQGALQAQRRIGAIHH